MMLSRYNIKQNQKPIAKLVAAFLVGALALGLVVDGATKAYAQANSSLDQASTTSELLCNGYPVYQGSIMIDCAYKDAADNETSFYYSDGYFVNAPSVYNEHLSTFSMVASCALMTQQSSRPTKFLTSIGATNVETKDFDITPTADTIGVAVAQKTLYAGTEDECTLLCVIVRGGGNYGNEWINNFLVGATGDHNGFTSAKEKTLAFLNSYISKYNVNTSNAKIWITGYSRAASISNLTARDLSDTYGKDKVYAYCLEPAMSTTVDKSIASSYTNIHVMSNANDPISCVAPTYMGFTNYGVVHTYADATVSDAVTQEAYMLVQLRSISDKYWKYDTPREFKWKKIELDISKIVVEGAPTEEALFADPKNNYGNNIQDAYAYLMEYLNNTLKISRATYSSNTLPKDINTAASSLKVTPLSMQDAMGKLAALAFTCDNIDVEALKDNFKDFPTSCPSLCLVLYSYVTTGSIPINLAGISSYSDLVSTTWARLSNGYGKFKSIQTCGLTDEQMAVIKQCLPTALYYVAQYCKDDFGNDKQTLGTLAYNADIMIESHCPEINLAWLRSFDSYYSCDVNPAFDQNAKQYETYIYASNGSTLTGTTITVTKPDGTTVIATIKDGAVSDSEKTTYDSSCVKLRGSGNEVSIVTLASLGNCKVTITADGKTAQNYVSLQIKRRDINSACEGSVEFSTGTSASAYNFDVFKNASVTATVLSNKTSITYTPEKRTYDMSGVTFTGEKVAYDGNTHSLAYKGTLPSGVTVSYDNNGQTDVGTYEVTAKFTVDSIKYNSIANKKATLEITQATNTITGLSMAGWTYGQTASNPSATAAFGQIAYAYSTSEDGAYDETKPSTAGTYWIKASVTGTKNYTSATAKTNFTIAKASYNMSGISFSNKTVTYDGSPKRIDITGTLPVGVSVSYTGNNQTSVGSHTVTAVFTISDTANYNSIPNKTATLTIEPANKAVFNLSGISNPGTTIYIDGVAKTMNVSGTTGTVVLDNANAKTATLYTYNKSSAGEDIHTIYPTHMYVWTLSGNGGKEYTVTRQSGLDDVLQYAGTAIRLTGNKGIRMITALPTNVKNALTSSSGYQGWKLEEYGTLIDFDETLQGKDVLTDTKFKNYAYKVGVADPIYAEANGLTKYTNVLVGFTNEQCAKDLSMRSYIILKNISTGESMTFYGGTTHRSIGYVALQNKDKYNESTDAGQFIWGIIRSVYGRVYG